jgi:hypothetical protein
MKGRVREMSSVLFNLPTFLMSKDLKEHEHELLAWMNHLQRHNQTPVGSLPRLFGVEWDNK